MRRAARLFMVLTGTLIIGCEPNSEEKTAVPSNSLSPDSQERGNQNAGTSDQKHKVDVNPVQSDQQATNGVSPVLSPSTSPAPSTGAIGQNPEEPRPENQTTTFNSQNHFDTVILPLFKSQCESCHVGPRVQVNPRGPLTIFNYDFVVGLLLKGSPSWNSAFVRKIRNLDAHGGGDRCDGSFDKSPCKDMRFWFNAILGPDSEPPPKIDPPPAGNTNEGPIVAKGFGESYEQRWDGNIQGYAYNPAAMGDTVAVEFYLGGPLGQGTLLGSVQAQLAGRYDAAVPGNHAFSYQIPSASFNSGQLLIVHMYAIIGTEKKELFNSPVQFYGYRIKNQAFYDANIAPLMGCGGCHGSWTAQAAFSALVTPFPKDGGTAATNHLYTKSNGQNHGGGAQCNGNVLCQNIQQWWNSEFSPVP